MGSLYSYPFFPISQLPAEKAIGKPQSCETPRQITISEKSMYLVCERKVIAKTGYLLLQAHHTFN
jgi:hypothetical protein